MIDRRRMLACMIDRRRMLACMIDRRRMLACGDRPSQDAGLR
jgi:hypothetical protein